MSTNRNSLQRLNPDRTYLAPSILSADFACLGREIQTCEAASVDMYHIDIMDGHFVPNLAMGPAVVASIRPLTSLPFNVHLMLSQPARYVEAFANVGADHLTFHIEADGDPAATIEAIAQQGCSAGLALKPGTPASAIAPYMDAIDLVLVMTVEPGFSGQSFRDDVVPKIGEVRELARQSGRRVHIEVDGGIRPATAAPCLAQGANILAAASSLFCAPESLAQAIADLRRCAS